MDRNQLLGQVLISQGLATKELIVQASLELDGEGELDLCDWLVERNHINSTQADNARFKVNLSASAKMLSSSHPIRKRPSESQVLAARKSLERGSTSKPRFGDYKIETELAKGPASSVFVARTVNSERVALKTLTPGRLVDDRATRRFLIDIKARSQLKHPNIVPILDFGVVDGQQFLVMEFIEGRSLSEIVGDNGAMESQQAARLVLKIAQALSHSHQSGLLHRDLNPDSIVIRSTDKEPILTDFGYRGEQGSNTEHSNRGLEYSAPELIARDIEFVDQRIDIYSLGATLYKLLTAQVPLEQAFEHRAVSLTETKTIVDPRALNSVIPMALAEICKKCLGRDPQKRYVSAAQVAEDIERFLCGEAVHASASNVGLPERSGVNWKQSFFRWLAVCLLVVIATALALDTLHVFEERADKLRSKEKEDQLESAAASLKFRSEQWQNRLGKVLARVEKKLKSTPRQTVLEDPSVGTLEVSDARQLNEDIDAALSRYLSPEKTRAFLSARQLNESLGITDPTQFATLIDRTLEEIPTGEWQARGKRLKGLIWHKLGDHSKARKFWTEAYCDAPRSVIGIQAFLESGESYAEDYEMEKARRIFRQLLTHKKGTREQRAKAELGLARLAIARGHFGTAGVLLEKKQGGRSSRRDKSRAKLYRAIVSQFAGQSSVPRSEFGERCVGIPGRALFWRIVEGRRIELNCLEWDGRAIQSKRWLHWTVEENARRISLSQWKSELVVIVELGQTGTEALQTFRIREKKVEKWGERCVLGSKLRNHEVLSIGDINKNGQADVFMRNKSQLVDGTLVFDVLNSEPSRVLAVPSQSCCQAARFIDLDGDSTEELVLSLGKWSDYRLAILNWDSVENRLKSRFEKILGFPRSLSVRPGKNGSPELLQMVDRNHRFDLHSVFGDDLNPQLPDAIWSIQFRSRSQQYRARPIVQWPFRERDRISPLLLRATAQLLPEYPRALLFQFHSSDIGVLWKLLPGDGTETIQLNLTETSGEIEFADVDKDGDLELVIVQSENIQVFGLKTIAERDRANLNGISYDLVKRNSRPRTSQLDIGLHLLKTENWEQGKAIVESAIKAGMLSESELRASTMALAQSDANAGQFLKARDRCLALAAICAEFSGEALLKSVSYSLSGASARPEMAKSIRAMARDHLAQAEEAILEEPTSSGLRRTLQRYQGLLSMKTLCQWDFSKAASYPKTLEIEGPHHFLRGAEGLRIYALGDSAAALRWPFEFQGGPLEIELELSVRWIERNHGFRLCVKEASGDSKAKFEVALNCKGRGADLSSYREIAAQFTELKGGCSRISVDHFDPKRRIKLTLAYDHLGLTREFRCNSGESQQRSVASLQQQLSPGLYQLCLEPTVKTGGPQMTSLATFVELHSLVVRGAMKQKIGTVRVELSAPEKTLNLGKRALILDANAEVLKQLNAFSAGAERLKPNDRTSSSILLMRALASARTGELEAATRMFQQARNTDKEGFEQFWTGVLPLLSEKVRRALFPLYYEQTDASYCLTQSRRFAQLGEPYKALLGLSPTSEATSEWRLLGAQMGARCGDYEHSLACLGPLNKSNDEARRLAGLCAYLSGDYSHAAELWQGVREEEMADPVFSHRFKRANRWVARARSGQ